MQAFLTYLTVGLWWGAVYFHLAVGITLIFGALRIFHFAHGDLCVFGALLACVLAPHVGLIPAAIIAVALAGALSVATYGVMYAPMLARGRTGFAPLLASIGLSIVISSCVLVFWGDGNYGLPGREHAMALGEGFSRWFSVPQLLGLASAILVAVAGFVVLHRTRWGVALRARADDVELAAVCGVPSRRLVLGVFLIGGLVGALGLLWLALDQGVNVGLGVRLSFRAFVVSVMGAAIVGRYSLPGSFLAALALGVGEQVLAGYLGSAYGDSLAYLVAGAMLLLAPPYRRWRESRRSKTTVVRALLRVPR